MRLHNNTTSVFHVKLEKQTAEIQRERVSSDVKQVHKWITKRMQ